MKNATLRKLVGAVNCYLIANQKQKLLLKILPIFFLFCVLTNASLHAQNIVINEFMASNGSTITDENGDFEDWVELYNAGNTAVDVGGLYLSDDLTELNQWQIPTTDASTTTIPAGGYLIIWFDKEEEQGILHADIKLGSGGEDIALTASDGVTLIDSYTFGPQTEDISEGRVGDANPEFDFFAIPTPGASNDTDPGAPMVEEVIASIAGGLYSTNQTVSLSTTTEDSEIYYTLDGSDPTESDNLYTAPISISETTTLRAKAFIAPLVPSATMTHTYLYNVSHTFAIVALSGGPDVFFDPATGIYPNYTEDIEVPINVEFYEPDGTLGFNQLMEVEISGSGSAVLPQKSLAAKAKSSLGSDIIDYPVFPDQDLDEYRSLVFRNSGQDWNTTMFHDAMVSSLVRDLSDIDPIIEEPKLYAQGFRPGVLYINGEYWGIHNVRERADKRFLKNRFNLDDNEIDFLDEENEVKEGTIDDWNDLQNFLQNNNFSSQTNVDQLATRVDLDAYLDYMVFNVFIDNYDWPGNNNRRWRERSEEDGEWRWMVKDLDFTFGLFQADGGFNTGDPTPNSLSRLQNPHPFNWPNPEWSTRLFNKLTENEEWRHDFINRMADQINVLYQPDRVNTRIDEFRTAYLPEIQQHMDRWANGFFQWEDNIEKLRIFGDGRIPNVYNHFINGFSDVNGTSNVTLNASPQDRGAIQFSTLTLGQAQFPWTGTYFTGVDIPVQAIPNRGYVLSNWSGTLSGNDAITSVNLSGNANITANFSLGSTSNQSIVINEINYNSPDEAESGDWIELYNPNNASVNISGWYFEDESGNYFPIPNNTSIPAGGYLVLIENEDEFLSIHPSVSNYIGEFGEGILGFGLSGGGELITLKNANGTLIDEVEYDDKSPWPTSPDGDGPTLQLIDPALDNALASSWQGDTATPGAENGMSTGPQNQTISFPSITDKLTTDAPFNLNAIASSGLSVSYTIIAGPATVSGNTLTLTGGEGTVTVQASQSGNANFNPAPSVNQSFNVTSPGGPGDYCAAQGQQPWQQWISNVNIEGIDNSSAKSTYTDYTSQSATVNAGAIHTISLTASFSGFNFDEYWRVWIDYNQDGIFQEPAEIAFSQVSPSQAGIVPNITTTGSINIPSNANTGTTRMRVSMKQGSYASPCETFTFGEVEDYSVNIAEGNTTSLTISCPNNITITAVQGANSAIVNWNSPTTNSNCPTGNVDLNQTGGLASGSSFSIGTAIISYEANDDCGNVENCSFNVTVLDGGTGPSDYCDSRGTAPWQQWISNVNFGSIDNSSQKDQYADFTNLSTEVNKGQAYNIQLTTGFSGFNFDEYWRVWIDYNQDGIFQEPAEIAFSQISPSQGGLVANISTNGTITIPASALSGVTRMRVSMQQGSYADSCETFDLGEVEDYSVIISGNGVPTLSLDCPSDITITAPQGSNSAVVNWTVPTASTTCTVGSVNLNQSGGLPNGSTFPSGTFFISYNASDGCGNIESCTFTIRVLTDGGGPTNYCDARGTAPWQQWISNVSIGTINNNSVKDQYADFTDQTTIAETGQSIPISLTTGFSGFNFDEYWRVWIDYNQDGVFQEPSEIAFSQLSPSQGGLIPTITINGNISIPASATLGTTRMRVSMQQGSYADPCETFDLGEVEDYSINIVNNQAVAISNDPFLYFTAQDEGSEVALNWITNTEEKNDFFILERSSNGIDFETLTTKRSISDEPGPAYYRWIDDKPNYGVNYYRLKQSFLDGTHAYTKVEKVIFNIDLEELAVFPNPTEKELYVNLKPFEGFEGDLQIYDALGQLMQSKHLEDIPDYPVRLELNDYKNGMYILTIKVEDHRLISKRIVLSRK